MESCNVLLYQATDAEDSFALRLSTDPSRHWRAQHGFGKEYEQIWDVEFQSKSLPPFHLIQWDSVLQRAIEAYNLSDPVITNFAWPQADLT